MLFVLATPEEVVGWEGRELTGAERPPGVGLASVWSAGPRPATSQAARAGPRAKQGEVSPASPRAALL